MMRYFISMMTRFLRKIKAASWAWGPALLLCLGGGGQAQTVRVPNFWDSKAQLERPDIPATRTVRFLVDDDFPPLHFPGLDGTPTGFSVELARAACERLTLPCTVQVRRFDTLLDALADRQGDVVAAAIPITADLRRRFAVTAPYFKIPARLAVKPAQISDMPVFSPKALQGKTIGVVEGTAHEAFAKAFMQSSTLKPYPELTAAQTDLKAGGIDYVFADGLGLALWIGGQEADGCCVFAGGPYLESRFFGEGIGFVLRSEDDNLRRALDYALQQLWREGKYAELYLRFFPISPF
ncbi:transporter substrate-binding domain-containing protein [Microvirga makkahensis]|uniref:Transporter substrate-binding domain-containing protein n=1 Tax=Microvirga makkahensis TaxID=1128670 RepID=A0A7X3MV16_9HYPH|nr:transporter substrate-binding domain-containing protein [Microvirga makkahensis]MXQ13766.1 transporter substrate-binding domain-containing protein [Microvirga makkahensis]